LEQVLHNQADQQEVFYPAYKDDPNGQNRFANAEDLPDITGINIDL
jgi:hypothetical protein